MSSKSKRQSKATEAAALSQSQLSTPQAGSSSQHAARVSSPVSPTRRTRIQEKNELAGLNNRFAYVIERNQFLEGENQSLTRKIEKFEEHQEKIVKKKVDTYEKEIHDARKIIDETAKERTKLNLENQEVKKDLSDAKQKLAKKTEDAEKLQLDLTQVSQKYNETISKNNALESKVSVLNGQVKELKDENKRLTGDITNLRTKLEQESVARVTAENQFKAKSEDFVRQNTMLAEEIREIKSTKHQEIEEVTGGIQQEYEAKLQQNLQELRDEYEVRIQDMMTTLEGFDAQKKADKEAAVERYKSSLHNKTTELHMQTLRNDELSRQVRDLETEKRNLLDRVNKLEYDANEDRGKFAQILSEKDSDIERIAGEKASLMQDYQDLMDTKVQLSNEIATYRKLLETEERRLSLKSPAASASLREMTPTARATPLRGKRKLPFGGLVSEESQENVFEYVSDSVSHGDIEITTDDPEGQFIRLRNKSDKDIPLNGYQLIRLSGELDTTHKFGRGSKILANDTATVWSSDAAGAKHSPPHDYALKEQKWSVSDHYKTVVVDNNHQEQAVRETRKEQVRHHKRRIGYEDPEELFHQDGGERAGTEKCIIM